MNLLNNKETVQDFEAIHQAVHNLLRAWISQGPPPPTLLDDFLLVEQLANERGGNHAASELILSVLNQLDNDDQTAANILRWRFFDNETLIRVAQRLHVSQHSISRQQRAAIVQLAKFVQEQEIALREERIEALEANLPPPAYSHLLGIDNIRLSIEESLLPESDPAVIILVGIGGIGKTALADAVTRTMIKKFQFDGVYWLRLEPSTMSGEALSHQHLLDQLFSTLAKQLGIQPVPITSEERLAKIRHILKVRSHLIVIDNLESAALTDFLFHHLAALAGPSKFLLTSRAYPQGQTAAHRFVLPELSQVDSVTLLRTHAAELGISALAKAEDEPLQEIYGLVGGNPLALKLVACLFDLLPLSQILKDLSTSRPGPVENLYRHIYWQTWQTLGESARDLLQAMPLVADAGGTPDYLQAISGLEGDRFWGALRELHTRSLLEVRGTLIEKRYGIHRLTETFVRTEIVGWPEGGRD